MREYRQEFIGSLVKVESTGIEGKIIDETRSTFTIQTKDDEKRVEKNTHSFIITTQHGKVKIPGDRIRMRPEDRIRHNW
ncbi:MAG TPA: ribonuclease P protein subunit [Candidatus Nanoarchaeia archaeon]|nr:ribonuclease P protein subunit [Candidatus Nanoarchaeia archaeon]